MENIEFKKIQPISLSGTGCLDSLAENTETYLMMAL